ncbi:AAA family ATPase [Priestia flexa]|uniref:AAA family ATPase n=1 Tax=Priestia flexa TaxID=86664 RepID=UPI001EF62623|nr:TniB family NTP-binding protein [Priestia flexa]MCG7313421.1 AAA family ATPase [Priestia flexa]
MITKEILSSDKRTKLKYFESCVVEHTAMEKVKEQLISYIENPAGASILLVLGPSGVGKTTLVEAVMSYFITKLKSELEQNGGRVPIARVELVGSDSGLFNWKDYYYRSLEELKEPLIDKKVNLLIKSEAKPKTVIPYHSRNTAPELRRSLENALKYREPVALLIDEAQHLLKVANAKRLQDQLDSIKSLANMSKVPHVLVGTYELKDFISLSGQLSRRTMNVHFPRYRINNEEEYHTFLSVIHALQQNIPLTEKTNLLEHSEFIYERTLGCIGILKDWLTRCLGEAIDNNKHSIDKKLLNKHAMPINALKLLFEEIEQGESLFKDNEYGRRDLLYRLGMKTISTADEKSTDKQDQLIVGRRKPTRDSVGK